MGVDPKAKLAAGDALRVYILALAEHDGPEKGVMFERWLVDALPQMPQTEVARAWRWQDAPAPLKRRAFGRSLAGLADTGVDVLAERHDGGLIAGAGEVPAARQEPRAGRPQAVLAQGQGQPEAGRQLGRHHRRVGQNRGGHASDARGALINAQSEWGDIPADSLGRAKPLQLDDNQKAAWRPA